MCKKNIYAAVLAGGKGERLWPKSRIRLPKQNLKFFGKRPIIQNTLGRARKIASANVFVITTKDCLLHTAKQLKQSGLKKVIVEPFGRNTAPAVGLAALLAFKENKDSILVVMPSDALVRSEKNFFNAVRAAIRSACRHEGIVTLGITPTSAETAYGYIRLSKRPLRILPEKAYDAVKFIEKPRPAAAGKFASDGRHFWNCGIFIFKTSAMLALLKKHTPILYNGLMSLPDIKERRRFDKELKRLYRKLNSRSLDYAILEKSKNTRVVPSNFGWSDLGSFNRIASLRRGDRSGNIVSGNHVGIDTKENLIFSDEKRLIATIGISGFIIVSTPDALLICDRNRSEEIKNLLKKIKKGKKFSKFL